MRVEGDFRLEPGLDLARGDGEADLFRRDRQIRTAGRCLPERDLAQQALQCGRQERLAHGASDKQPEAGGETLAGGENAAIESGGHDQNGRTVEAVSYTHLRRQ